MSNLTLQGVGMTSQRTRERLIQRLQERGIRNQRVLEAMRNTPRHLFLDEALSHRAYEDTALPIGYGQTLSQPYIVARMTEALLQTGGSRLQRVLEVGTGSGYQAAILSPLVPEVYSVERIKPLLDRARQRFRELGLRNIQLDYADGTLGWPARGPFNGIITTAAPREVPQELLAQLAPDGVLVIPVGGDTQQLRVIVREGDSDQFNTRILETVKFVPLLSGLQNH